MIISPSELRAHVDTTEADEILMVRLAAIEAVIREYTNNNFQQRGARFIAKSSGPFLYGNYRFFNVGDTVEISMSEVNDGLYLVDSVGDGYIEIEGDLFDVDFNLVTKVVYPPDVVQCAVDLFKWKMTMGNKVGVKSETLSRHSVTYEDSATLYMGYPVGILNGLKLHKKVRF